MLPPHTSQCCVQCCAGLSVRAGQAQDCSHNPNSAPSLSYCAPLKTSLSFSCASCCQASEWRYQGQRGCIPAQSVPAPHLHGLWQQEHSGLGASRPWALEYAAWRITLLFSAKTSAFLFICAPFPSLQTGKAVSALFCCPALTHTSSPFIMARRCCCGRNVKWPCNETRPAKYLYQMASLALMLHKPNSVAL